MQQNTFLLYGANGYSGELIARFAHQYGLQPILAGRRKEAIEPLATRLNLPYRIVDLFDSNALKAALQDVPLVVQAAGPYHITAQPMVEACLATNTHYIDLNGDTDVFDMLLALDSRAKASNIMILPGAGFDVVPTDCLALWLKNRMPDATHLSMAFAILGSALSRGTTISTLHKLGMPGAVRKDGKLVPEPVGKRGMTLEFPGRKEKIFVMSLPWGDVSTAYFTTGIPNIVAYTSINKAAWYLLKAQSAFNWLLRTSFMRKLVAAISIPKSSAGPDDAMRDKAISLVWGKATNAKGETLTAHMSCPEAYSLTTDAILTISKKILEGNYKPGYQTPGSAYGEDLVLEIPGVKRN
ncbi:saccharopine dehydrogenase family protein [Chitinophaga tropicalis]|uniref:Saccharopine dehydrogenase n=1 Tax=Chitinophaga tropicalis TaxID=2683588 RepID=A0A7K1UDJ7_9BACT|nr:saccharopine dehydrogenase NADP-binding domain-containing protein [Chitinophaga tropicalis]MVT12403.1 saccharopine dehydrogenase [Chitinophaga tropicalis]